MPHQFNGFRGYMVAKDSMPWLVYEASLFSSTTMMWSMGKTPIRSIEIPNTSMHYRKLKI